MADGAMTRADEARVDEARARAYATPLDEFQVHAIDHFTSDTLWPWFERLRAEDPVHYTAESEYGPYWSLTRYADIVAADGDNHRLSSSSVHGGITLFLPPESATAADFAEDIVFFAAHFRDEHGYVRIVDVFGKQAGEGFGQFEGSLAGGLHFADERHGDLPVRN